MEAVGELIGLSANEGGLGHVHRPVHLLGGHVGELLGEELLHLGEDGLKKGQGAADDVLIEPGLALVDAHGGPSGEAGVVIVRVHVQLIPGMSPLVDDGIHGAGHVILQVVGGDAQVLGIKAQGEGVLGLPDGAVSPVQSHDLHEVVGELPLILHGVAAVEEADIRLFLLPNGMDDRHQPVPHGGEELVQFCHGDSPLILVEQGVIGGLVGVIVPGKAAVVCHQLLQHWGKEGEVVGLLGPVPHIAGLVDQHGVLHILLGGNAGELAVLPAQQLHLAALLGGELLPGLGQGLQHLPHLGVRENLVLLPGQNAQGHPTASGGIPGGHGDPV